MTRLYKIYVLWIILLFPLVSFGFELTVNQTNETCPGNASLTFAVSNPDPNGTILYAIYKLPNLITPYSSGPNSTITGLTFGDYRIIARETINGTTTTQQQDVSITSTFTPLSYTVQALNQACSDTSSISVIVTTGTAATYAIISGPVILPPQASNTFSGLPVGVYKVRVIDTCGNSVVQTFTVTLSPTNLNIAAPVFSAVSPPSCNSVVVTNTLSAAPGTVIGYPLSIQYILHLPVGNNTVQTILNSGNPTSEQIALTVPYQINQNYTYDIIITDACGTIYPMETFLVNNNITLSPGLINSECNDWHFSLTPANFVGSYTLLFTNVPAGFNPVTFNSSYPGPFNQPSVDFGSENQPVPFGDYEVSITDSCGKTTTIQFTIIDEPPVPTILGTNNGCLTNSGNIEARILGIKILTAIVTIAPSSYPFALPHNVTSSIDTDGVLFLDPVPLGDYTIQITDECGTIISPLTVTVPAFVNQGFEIEVLQGCDTGKASVKITGNNSPLTSVKITAAPTGSGFALPYDISANIINNGTLYMADLSSGNYTFSTVDSCGFTSNKALMINGYTITSSSFSLTANCGSFNIPLNFVDNVTGDEIFGLQKLLDATTNTWGNPATGAFYTEGTAINDTNSYLLQNNATNFNLTYNGTFRIVHDFTSYNNGSDINNNIVTAPTKSCIEILSPSLSFNNALAINDVYRVPCSSTGNLDVLLLTNGTPPLHFRITEKDGNPFVLDNGTSDVFLNLQPGTYKFDVEDSCGNSVNRTFDVSDLASLITIGPVCDLFTCASTITGNETFDLSAQTALILGDQSPSDYTLSYHSSQADADTNSNPIANLTNFNPISNPATVYIRLVFNQLPNCYQTGSFNLITGQAPVINLLTEYLICDSQPISLDASAGNLAITTYSWSNGSTVPGISVSEIGTTALTLTATNTYGACNGVAFSCSTSEDLMVIIADLPEIIRIDSEDWTDNENSITVVTSHEGAFEYSLDGINFQDIPVFTNLRPGLYTVFVRDVSGCKTVTAEVWLLNYPKFFTPNGDGYNDTWFVKNSDTEPDFKVYIYDRYGKLITGIVSNGSGWDGKYNGKVLFADDYWFTAYRQDGRVLRGHFTLKR